MSGISVLAAHDDDDDFLVSWALGHINSCKLFNAKSCSIYIYIYIYIIIIMMPWCRHGYPWPSLATSPYRSLPLAGLQGYILYPHIAAGCMFELVVLLLPGHMWGSIGVHHLWAHPCFSSNGNLLSFLLRCGTRPYERGTQWDSNSLV